jgi:hypothetical protein
MEFLLLNFRFCLMLALRSERALAASPAFAMPATERLDGSIDVAARKQQN